MILFHGGIGGLRPGDVIEPGHAGERYVDGCPTCEAHRRGESTAIDPRTPDGWVYATADRQYARYYASRAVKGSLYRVEMRNPEQSDEDLDFLSWRDRQASVVSVLERCIVFTMKERKRLFVRWGGNPREFDSMLVEVSRAH